MTTKSEMVKFISKVIGLDNILQGINPKQKGNVFLKLVYLETTLLMEY